MSSPIIKFFGIVKGGRVYLDNQDQYEAHLHTLDEKRIELIVQKEQKERTNQQSKYLFGVVYQLISEETGYSKEEVHEMMKSIYLKDNKVVNNKRYTVIRSTSSLTTVEMVEYIENIKRWSSSELGLNIPDSNEFFIK
jgi:hypothetical protein